MRLRTLAAVAAFLLVSGCGTLRCGEAGPYMDAETVAPLVVPDGLAKLDRSRQMPVPEAADVVHPELRGRRVMQADGSMRCLEAPPPPRT